MEPPSPCGTRTDAYELILAFESGPAQMRVGTAGSEPLAYHAYPPGPALRESRMRAGACGKPGAALLVAGCFYERSDDRCDRFLQAFGRDRRAPDGRRGGGLRARAAVGRFGARWNRGVAGVRSRARARVQLVLIAATTAAGPPAASGISRPCACLSASWTARGDKLPPSTAPLVLGGLLATVSSCMLWGAAGQVAQLLPDLVLVARALRRGAPRYWLRVRIELAMAPGSSHSAPRATKASFPRETQYGLPRTGIDFGRCACVGWEPPHALTPSRT
jgi:hypothetical protein